MSLTVVGSGNPSAPTYPVQRSVRLRSSASAYFNRTVSVAGNRRTWTWSGWVKRGTLGVSQRLFNSYSTNENNTTEVGFDATNNIIFSNVISGSQANGFYGQTSAVFRDPSAWYHIVFSVDTTQSTAAAALKVYVNGLQQTLGTSSYGGGANQNTWVNAALPHLIGQTAPPNNAYFDGYLTEVNFIDGQQLTPSSFGAYNSYGVWSPAKYSGTYGTNGFYLNFQDNSAATAAAIGKDSSGNGNNWTPNNISVTAGVTYDSMLDVPTLTSANNANYCVLNPLAANTSTAPTQGNLYLGTNGPNNFACVATMGVSSGKWYWEVKPDSGFVQIGITSLSSLPANLYPGSTGSLAKSYYGANGQKFDNGTQTAYGASFTTTDIIGVALDMDAGTITFYKNNTSQGVAFSGLSGLYFPIIGCPNTYNAGYLNFGAGSGFTYTPPTGFNRLNTFNLPNSVIPNGAAVMAATLYTGNGSTQSILNSTNTTTGVSFQPDFVWVKGRSGATDHALYDSVRGTTKDLVSNSTAAETTQATGLTAFSSSGFSIGALAKMNTNAATYVGWQWKANGTPATINTGGVIPSTVSANPTAGFSIVTYTGTGTGALSSVGHGLGVAPKMIILKNRGSVTNWPVYHASLTSAAYTVFLNATNAQAADIGYWGSTPPDSGQFYIYGTSGSYSNILGATYVAYCWSEIAGFSKFGSYTGNGSTDGPFVYCGFRPRWLMVKRTDAVSGGWYLWDTSRNTYNTTTSELYANLSNAEATGTGLDIISNGFKIRATATDYNASGGTYIFACFAENPLKNALAR